jgi:hypothetical protein
MVLSSLWMLQGCAPTAKQSGPVPAERSPEVESLPSVGPEAPIEVQPEVPAEVEPSGPAKPEAPDEIEPLPEKSERVFYVHVVRWPGETLSLIAHWYTASSYNWREIEKANPGIDPKRIALGNRILIPASLLKKRNPMPFHFLSPRPAGKESSPPLTARIPLERPDKTPIPKPAPTPAKSTVLPKEMELFGPRETTAAPMPIPEEMRLFGPREAGAPPATTPGEPELFGPGEIAGRPAKILEETELFGPVD